MKSNRIPRLLAVIDIADLLGVSIKTVRRWIDRGDLRAHHLGRRVRVSEEDLNAFLNQRRR
jgi:excisionase family DNA binding protein